MKLTAEATVLNDDKLTSSINNAQNTADSAKTIADNTNQYFWFTSSGTDTGAHISEKTQAQFIASPSGGNLLARSNGIAVRDGLTELATFGASNARIGRTNAPNVDITTTSITMSDGTHTAYELKTSTGAIKVTRTYNQSLPEIYDEVEEDINIGRTMSAFTSAVVKFSVNGTNYTKTYNSLPVVDNSNANVYIGIDQASSNIISFSASAKVTANIVVQSIEINFTTTQQATESAIGAFASTSNSGVLRVGNGTATNATSNAMLVDWAGNGFFNGDVLVNCDDDSTGGMSLTKASVTWGAIGLETSTQKVSADVFRMGNLVTLDIEFKNTASVDPNTSVFEIELTNVHIPMPVNYHVTGASVYGQHSLPLLMYQDTGVWKLRARNASASAVTVSTIAYASLTYITDGNYFDDYE